MSKAKTPTKVLRAAHNRLSKSWTQGRWTPNYQGEGGYCIVGAICGRTVPQTNTLEGLGLTQAQKDALVLMGEAMDDFLDDHPERREESWKPEGHDDVATAPLSIIPHYNDSVLTHDEVLSITKLAIIKAETAQLMALDGIDDEEIDDLLEDLSGGDAA